MLTHPRLRFSPSEDVDGNMKAGIDRSRVTRVGKHSGGCCAPVCEYCNVTLSSGRCLNRMCDNFNKTEQC